MHVTVLGWNVNNKEECPSVQRVPGGEGVWVHKATALEPEQISFDQTKKQRGSDMEKHLD